MRIKMDLRNCDCMDLMKEFPDKYFDLAIVDPPYGGGGQEFRRNDKSRFGGRFDKFKTKVERDGRGWAKKYGYQVLRWDSAPDEDYFEELFRVSQNQIIWGGNYFQLPPNRHFIIWEKESISESFSMAMCEYAWSSMNENAKIFKFRPQDKDRFHPTQKPVALYKWLLEHYAKQGDKILDTHLGSMSSVIACYDEKFDITGAELDPDYFKAGMERVNKHTSQVRLDDII